MMHSSQCLLLSFLWVYVLGNDAVPSYKTQHWLFKIDKFKEHLQLEEERIPFCMLALPMISDILSLKIFLVPKIKF